MELEIKFENMPFHKHYQKQWLEQGKAESYAESFAEGFAEAQAEIIQHIARQTGKTPEEIAEFTGFEVARVRELLDYDLGKG